MIDAERISATTAALIPEKAHCTTSRSRKLLIKAAIIPIIITEGVTTPRVAKIGGKFRARVIIKCRDSKRFREMIGNLLKNNEKNSKYKDVSLYAELNPENVM